MCLQASTSAGHVFPALHWNSTYGICFIDIGLYTLFFNDIQLHRLSISCTAKVLPGSFSSMAIWCTNASPLVSFLLTKSYLLPKLNYFTVLKSFVVVTFLSPTAWCQRCQAALGRYPWCQAGCQPAAQVGVTVSDGNLVSDGSGASRGFFGSTPTFLD